MAYTNIKGAKELLKKYKDEFKLIDASLEELEDNKSKLENDLGDSSERFTMDSIKKNADKKHELNLMKQYIKEAHNQRNDLKEEAQENSFDEAREILRSYRDEIYHDHKDINKAIVQKLYEVRGLYQELVALDKIEHGKVSEFVEDLLPYLPDKDKLGGTTNAYGLTKDLKAYATRPDGQFIHRVPEASYEVKGMVVADDKITDNTKPKGNQLDDIYQVDVDEVQKEIENVLKPIEEV